MQAKAVLRMRRQGKHFLPGSAQLAERRFTAGEPRWKTSYENDGSSRQLGPPVFGRNIAMPGLSGSCQPSS